MEHAVRITSPTIKIVCISDTHNDNPTPHIPDGDILCHAGDFTDNGTDEELQAAYDWISELPHKIKILVSGNHDLGLDPNHPKFSPKALELFTSDAAKAAGIHYLNDTLLTVATYISASGTVCPIRVYGNPRQPDFLNSPYCFTYKPYPSPTSVAAWSSAPESAGPLDIWVMHSPPRHRLDVIDVPPLVGCEEQARVIAKARPAVCVFGHYHSSWGLERVKWAEGHGDGGEEGGEGVREAKILSHVGGKGEFDFTGEGDLAAFKGGEETLFMNSAWMTMKKGKVAERNMPFVVKITLPGIPE